MAGIKLLFSKRKLDWKNIVEIKTDNKSVMTGSNNGVYATFKEKISLHIVIRCVCHKFSSFSHTF